MTPPSDEMRLPSLRELRVEDGESGWTAGVAATGAGALPTCGVGKGTVWLASTGEAVVAAGAEAGAEAGVGDGAASVSWMLMRTCVLELVVLTGVGCCCCCCCCCGSGEGTGVDSDVAAVAIGSCAGWAGGAFVVDST